MLSHLDSEEQKEDSGRITSRKDLPNVAPIKLQSMLYKAQKDP